MNEAGLSALAYAPEELLINQWSTVRKYRSDCNTRLPPLAHSQFAPRWVQTPPKHHNRPHHQPEIPPVSGRRTVSGRKFSEFGAFFFFPRNESKINKDEKRRRKELNWNLNNESCVFCALVQIERFFLDNICEFSVRTMP